MDIFYNILDFIQAANLSDLEAPFKPQCQSQLETPVCEPISQTVSSLSSHMSQLSKYLYFVLKLLILVLLNPD